MFQRFENENEEQFLWRIGKAKDSGSLDMSWKEISDIINSEFRTDPTEYRTESAYRKKYQNAKILFEAGVFNTYTDDSYISELTKVKHEIQKEKQKLFDERTALNNTLREQGRIESMFDVVKRAINEYIPTQFDYSPIFIPDSDKDFIIHLTDIHCGVNINSPLNVFNSNILEQRLKNFLNEIYDLKEIYHPESAYLILGGDIIQGLIHTNSRIESKEDVIQQVMIATDLVENFIYELSKWFKNVEIHTTIGNHGRTVANKKESVKKENFDLLIPFGCKKGLKNIENIKFIDNFLGCDIATFKVRGHMVYASHGDKDTPDNVVYNMTKFARKANLPLPDMCYLGHRHTNGLTTVDEVKIIESGCVDGIDSYAIDKRLTGRPEQTVTVVTEKKMIKALCDIQID